MPPSPLEQMGQDFSPVSFSEPNLYQACLNYNFF